MTFNFCNVLAVVNVDGYRRTVLMERFFTLYYFEVARIPVKDTKMNKIYIWIIHRKKYRKWISTNFPLVLNSQGRRESLVNV